MITITDFLDPVPEEVFEDLMLYKLNNRLVSMPIFSKNEPIDEHNLPEIAIIGVNEYRNAIYKTSHNSPNQVRKQLYNLYKCAGKIRIADFGNLKQGKSVTDSYFALKEVTEYLLKNNVLPIIIGGSQDLTYPIFQAMNSLEQVFNISVIDSLLDIGDAETEFNSQSYLSKILLDKSAHLFNYSILAQQTYLNSEPDIELLKHLFFDNMRLGEIRENLKFTEPIMRDTDLLSIDLSSIKFADAQGQPNPSPNGLTGDEICQITRYAGLSDRLKVLGIFDYSPDYDHRSQTAALIAQMIWCFIDGYVQRRKDYPFCNLSEYKKFSVSREELTEQIVFYKSSKTDRWWMEVPYYNKKNTNSLVVSCNYEDYLTACNGELPDRWWKFYQKIS